MQLWREKKLTSCHKLGSDVVPIQPGWPEHPRTEQLELLRCREHQLRSACNVAADITNFVHYSYICQGPSVSVRTHLYRRLRLGPSFVDLPQFHQMVSSNIDLDEGIHGFRSTESSSSGNPEVPGNAASFYHADLDKVQRKLSGVHVQMYVRSR